MEVLIIYFVNDCLFREYFKDVKTYHQSHKGNR